MQTAGLVTAVGTGILPKNVLTGQFAEVLDGLSNTIMLAESAGRPYVYRKGSQRIGNLPAQRVNGGGWCRPASDFSIDGSSFDGATLPGPCAINCTNGEDFGSSAFPHPYYGSEGTSETYAFHPGAAQCAFGDGSVRALNARISIRTFAALVTRDKAEVAASN